MIVFECPNCGNSISVEDDHAGRSAWCRKCRRISTVPRPQSIERAGIPVPGTVAIGAPLARLGESLHPTGSAVPVHEPIPDIAGRPIEWNLRQANDPIDLKHIRPEAREEVRASVAQAVSEVERLAQQRSDAVKLLQESAAEISRLIGELAAAREENKALRAALDAHSPGDAPPGSIDHGGEARRLRELLEGREEEIARLTNDWAAAREEIASLKAALAQNSVDAARVNELPQAMARDLDAALTALAEREHEVLQLNAALAEARQRLEETAAGPPPDRFDALICERDQRIADLLEHERRALQEAESLRKTLEERDAEFQAAYFEMSALRKTAEERDRLASDYADISQTLVDSRTRLKEQETKRAAVEQELHMAQEQLAEKDAELQRIRYELAELQQRIEAARSGPEVDAPLTEIARDELQQEIEGLKAQSAAATQRAWSLHHALEKAAARIKDRDAEIERLSTEIARAREREEALAAAARDRDTALASAAATNEQLKVAFDEALALASKREEELALARVEAGQWQSRLDEHAGEIQQLVFERDLAAQQRQDAETEVQAERKKLREVADDLARTQAELEETRTYLIQREQRLESALAEVAQWQARDAEREVEIQRLNARLDEASRQVEAAAFDTEAERAKWQPLVASHEEMKAALDDMRAQLATRDEQIRSLQAITAERESLLAARDNAIAALEESLVQAQAALRERDDKVDDLDFQVAGLTATLREKEETFARLSGDLDVVKQELAVSRQAEAEAQSALALTQDELQKLKELLAAAQSRLGPADAELGQLRDAAARLNAREKELRSALDHRTSEVETLLADINEFKTREQKNAEEMERLRGEIAARSAALEQAEIARREFEARAEDRAAEQEQLQTEMAELRARLASREEEAEQAYRDRTVAQNELAMAAAAAQDLKRELEAQASELARRAAEIETLRENVEVYRESSGEFEKQVATLRAELELYKSEKESLQLAANEAQRNAARYDIELASLRAELEKHATVKGELESVALGSQEAASRFQSELDTLRAEFERTARENDELRRAVDSANSERSYLEAELAKARDESAQLDRALADLRGKAEESARSGADLAGEIEALRYEVQRLQRESDDLKSEREQESRRLTQQLEQAASEVSRSAQEIQRLSEELEAVRRASVSASGVASLDEAFKLQHSYSATSDELWKDAPAAEGGGEPVTPEVMNPEAQDEQKMLVDALLRFLGRR